jgi:hypothetical protein
VNTNFQIAGIACMAAAIVGGGLEAFGIKVPLLHSVRRQVVLALFGCVLLIAAGVVGGGLEKESKLSVISYVRDGTAHHGEFRRSGKGWIETFENDLNTPRYWTEVPNPAGKLRLASSGAVIEIDLATQAIDYSGDGKVPFNRLDTITSVAKE